MACSVRNLPFINILILAKFPGFEFPDSEFVHIKKVPLYLESIAFIVTVDTSGHFDSRQIMKFPIFFTSSKELALVYTFVPIRLVLNSSLFSSHWRRVVGEVQVICTLLLIQSDKDSLSGSSVTANEVIVYIIKCTRMLVIVNCVLGNSPLLAMIPVERSAQKVKEYTTH